MGQETKKVEQDTSKQLIEELKRKVTGGLNSLVANIHDRNQKYAEEFILEYGEYCLALCRSLTGRACPFCGGYGVRAYGSTATWKGGIGGQAITQDVCDQCWGSGLSDRQGTNLKNLFNELRRLDLEIGRLKKDESRK